MKKQLIQITAIAALAVAVSCKQEANNEVAAAEAVETPEMTTTTTVFNADTANSIISWKGFKPTGTHTGTLAVSEGEFHLEDNRIAGGKFTFDMNTITVTDLEGKGKDNLEAHLKGTVEEKKDHFFNVQEFPTASFEVTGSRTEGEQTFLSGNLTIKGITKNVEFPVTITTSESEVTVSSEPFTIDRTLWNVNYKSQSVFEGLGDKFINDEIELTLKVTANKG